MSTRPLKVTELDFDLIKSNLKTFLKGQSEFADYDFEGAGLNVLLDILSYNTHYNAYYLNMIANESFLDTSLIRNSIISHAKTLGYTPFSKKSAKAKINVTVDMGSVGTGTLVLPKGFKFRSSSLDNISYNFVTKQDYIAEREGSRFFYFNNVEIFEGQFVTNTFVYDQAKNPKQLFTIPNSSIDTDTLKVSVLPDPNTTDLFVYAKSNDVLLADTDSEIYFLQEGRDGKYEIYFGDDILGKALNDGAIVYLEYVSTNGEEGNKLNQFSAASNFDGNPTVSVELVYAAFGGSERESIEQIKFSSQLQYLSQNRAVTKNDYIKLLQEKYPSLDAVNVWGGEENQPPVFGKVFICAKPKNGFEFTDSEKQYVKDNIIKPISMLTVTPDFIDVDYNYLAVDVKVFYDQNKTMFNESELKTKIINDVRTFCDVQLNKFNSIFSYSGLEKTILNADKSIVSNETKVYVGKRFRPNLEKSDNYVLDFGIELNRGTSQDNIFSYPNFDMYDGNGVLRQCFLEEVPSSFSGVESIVVIRPGLNYTSTPTVEIIGDGEGAEAVAEIVNGKLNSVTVTKPGIGYTSAIVNIVDGGGTLAMAEAILEGRYGKLRTSYYTQNQKTSQNIKIILNENAGTIDYLTGKIYLNNFNPIAIGNDFQDIEINFRPMTNSIQSSKNKMLVFDDDDARGIVVKMNRIR